MTQWQITLKFTQESNAARCVLHYNQVGAGTPSWPDVLQEFAVAWSGGLAGSYSPGTLFTGINVLEKAPGAVSLDFDLAAPGLPGTGVDEPGPAQVASLVTLIGDLPVKPARGRIYLPSPNREQYGTTGVFILAHTTRVQEWMSDIVQIDDTEGILLDLVIYSRVFPLGNTIQWNQVGQWTVRGNPATQRKRRIGVGS